MRTKQNQSNLAYNNQGLNGIQPQQQRVGDWRCVICSNINFAFRN